MEYILVTVAVQLLRCLVCLHPCVCDVFFTCCQDSFVNLPVLRLKTILHFTKYNVTKKIAFIPNNSLNSFASKNGLDPKYMEVILQRYYTLLSSFTL